MTVTGPVAISELGKVQMHEHLICDLEHSKAGLVAGLNDVDLASEELGLFRRAGGTTVVECTNRGVGRNVQALKRISEATGVNIIASTGYYTEPYYPHEVFDLTIPELAQVMIDEIVSGIDDTGVRAGIIAEIGSRRRCLSPAEERVFRAAGRAQRATGLAVSTHTYDGAELALQQVDVLMDEGVAADRIIIGHLGDWRTVDYFCEIASRGVYIQFDHIGMEELQSDIERARSIREMVDHGFAPQVLLSSDVCYKRHLHKFGGFGYDHLLREFVPMLLEVGVSAKDVDGMLTKNPARALGSASKGDLK